MKKKWLYIGVPVFLLAIVLVLFLTRSDGPAEKDITVEVKRGYFESFIITTGELQAENSIEIQGPPGLRSAGIWNVQITELIPEGSRVKQGDMVAKLDQSEVIDELNELNSAYDALVTQLTQMKLDTTLELSEAREQIINYEYALEVAELTVEQSTYEPPAVQRQAQIDLEKAQRTYDQAVINYAVKVKQAEAQVEEILIDMSLQMSKIEMLENLLGQFVITAPSNGLLVYKRNWNNTKRTVGTTISPWDLVVAELPDLSSMISVTSANEVDISRVQEGQQVEIGVDAFPDRKYTGEIIYVSSIGEQKQNSSSKVFEVKVRIFETDTTLRPAMTTSNRIILSTQEDVLYIPSDCIHRRDSLHFVYTNQGEELIKQEVRTGAYNENETVIESGLKEGQKIYLSVPEGAEEAPLQRLDATSLIFERDIKPTSMLNQFPVGITPVQPFMASPA